MLHQDRGKLIEVFRKKNAQLNLSAIRDPEGIFVKHIQDSLEVYEIIKFPPQSKVADIGTGSGFPLLPLAMLNPESTFTGIESIAKKAKAVNEIAAELGITNMKVERSRAEQFQGQFDAITARAVAYSDKLLKRTWHLVQP